MKMPQTKTFRNFTYKLAESNLTLFFAKMRVDDIRKRGYNVRKVKQKDGKYSVYYSAS